MRRDTAEPVSSSTGDSGWTRGCLGFVEGRVLGGTRAPQSGYGREVTWAAGQGNGREPRSIEAGSGCRDFSPGRMVRIVGCRFR